MRRACSWVRALGPVLPRLLPVAVYVGSFLLLAGCANPDVNAARPKANTGYVDFHAGAPGELCWEVSRQDPRSGEFHRVFSSLKPPADGVLRLAFRPGTHRLRMTFLNRFVAAPAEIQIEVRDLMITPVRVALKEVGTTSSQTKDRNWEGIARGRYGRRLEYNVSETAMYEISALSENPVPYEVKKPAP